MYTDTLGMYPRIESSRPGAFIMWEVHGVQCLVTTVLGCSVVCVGHFETEKCH